MPSPLERETFSKVCIDVSHAAFGPFDARLISFEQHVRFRVAAHRIRAFVAIPSVRPSSLSSTVPSWFDRHIYPTHFCNTSGRSSPPSPSTTASMPIVNRPQASQLQLWRCESKRGKRISTKPPPELLEWGWKCLPVEEKCTPFPTSGFRIRNSGSIRSVSDLPGRCKCK